MTYLKALARAAALAFCAVAFCGTALADPGNGNGGPAATPPGQEKKAEAPVTPVPTPVPQAAAGAEHAAGKAAAAQAAAPGQAKKAKPQAKKAEQHTSKPDQAKADHAAKAVTPAKAAATSNGESANAHHHVIVCHRTGSLSNPYVVINIPSTAWMHAHSDTTGSHPDLNGNHDKLLKDPASRPGSKDGFTKAACGGVAVSSTPTTQVTPSSQQTGNCPATITTTEQVLVGIKHHTGSKSNPYVVVGPSEKSAHMNGKHADDQAMYETRTVTRTVSGANCASVTQATVTPTGQQPTVQLTAQPTVQLAAQPVGEVAGAVSPANAKASAKANAKAAPKSKPAGGVLGAVASAPKAVAQTATSSTLPFTGIPLWIAALIGGALLASGLVLRRPTS